jgi:hypothetical protein
MNHLDVKLLFRTHSQKAAPVSGPGMCQEDLRKIIILNV